MEHTLRCLFLQRSQALLDGTPGIVDLCSATFNYVGDDFFF